MKRKENKQITDNRNGCLSVLHVPPCSPTRGPDHSEQAHLTRDGISRLVRRRAARSTPDTLISLLMGFAYESIDLILSVPNRLLSPVLVPRCLRTRTPSFRQSPNNA